MMEVKRTKKVNRQLAVAVLTLVFVLGVAFVKKDIVHAGTLVGVTNLYQDNMDAGWIQLRWDSDINAYAYQLEYSIDGANWSSTVIVTDLKYDITGLSAGRSYYVRMRSINSDAYYNILDGNPQYSDWCQTFEGVTSPYEVSNLVQSNGDSSSITVSWDASDGATKYQVYYELGGSEFLAGETTKTTFKVKGLDPDKSYRIWVYAVRESAAGFKAKSYGAYHDCYTTAGKIKKLQLDSWNTDDNTIKLTWSDNEFYKTGYEVSVTNLSGKKVKNFAVTDASAEFSVSSIKNKGCIVRVRAYLDIDGVEIYGKWSDAKVIVAQPRVVLEKKSNKSVKLKWAKVSGATSYTVYRSTSSYTGFKKIKTTKSTSLVNSGLKADTTYYYYVVANGVKVKGKSLKSTKAAYREIAYLGWNDRTEYTYEMAN